MWLSAQRLYGRANGDLLQQGFCTCCVSQVCSSQSPCLHSRPLLTGASAGDTQTLKGRSGSFSVGSLGPSAHRFCLSPLCREWGLILNMISPLLLSCWDFSFAIGYGVSFFGGIQHSPINGCSAESCNFGALIGEDECMTFCSTESLRRNGVSLIVNKRV